MTFYNVAVVAVRTYAGIGFGAMRRSVVARSRSPYSREGLAHRAFPRARVQKEARPSRRKNGSRRSDQRIGLPDRQTENLETSSITASRRDDPGRNH